MEHKLSSHRLERVASQPGQASTRTRSGLSLGVDSSNSEQASTSELSDHSSASLPSEATNASKSTEATSRSGGFSRLSRKFLSKGPPESSDSETSGSDYPREGGSKRFSRNLFANRSASSGATDASERRVNARDRKSRGFFLPKTLSMLRISTKASDLANDDEDDDDESEEKESPGPSSAFATESQDSSGTRGSSPIRSLRMFRREPALTATIPDNMDPKLFEDLETVLLDFDKRDRLVDFLLAEHVEGGSPKVRFMAAVIEFERMGTGREKLTRGKKIAATFLQKDAPFPVPGIPRDIAIAANLDALPALRIRVAIDLLSSPMVVDRVKELALEEDDPFSAVC